MDNQNKLPDDDRLKDVDQAELEAFVQKRLAEEQSRREQSTSAEVKIKSLGTLGSLLTVFVLGLFVTSPFIQLLLRVIKGLENQPLMLNSSYVRYYQWTIRNTHYIAGFTALIVLLWLIVYTVIRRRSDRNGVQISISEHLWNYLPMLIFIAFVISIILVTVIRGPNEYDLTGHPYMYESIYSYITYPLVYFFCGMMLFSEKARRLIMYLLIFTALPVNILAAVDYWIVKLSIFGSKSVCAVFHNSNHYGYYLAITLICSALLFVYEKKLWLRIVEAVSSVVAAVVLIVNNTLGAYLAVLFVLILFVVYSFVIVKQHKRISLILLICYLAITLVMSFFYNTVFSSVIGMFTDIGRIIDDPLETKDPEHSSGIARWKLWTSTVKYLKEKPFTGFGVEGMLNTHHVGTPHNEFLQYAEFFGIQTSLLYIAACCTVMLRVFFKLKTVDKTTVIGFFVCLGYLASSFFGVAIYYTTPFIYIFLGLTYAGCLRHSTEAEET